MRINNLGVINNVNLDFNKIMVFTGENNSGKTYSSYLLYGIISSLTEDVRFQLWEEDQFNEILHELRNGSYKIELTKEEVENKFYNDAMRFIQENLLAIAISNFKLDTCIFDKLKVKINREDMINICGNLFNYREKTITTGGIEIKLKTTETKVTIEFDLINVNSLDRFLSEKKVITEVLNVNISKSIVTLPKVFYFPAERNGINVFKNELNERRLKTYDTLLNTIQFTNLKNKKEKEKKRDELFMNNLELLLDGNGTSLYPKPISDYINFLNNMRNDNKKISNSVSEYIRANILKGKYEIDDHDNSVTFRQKFGKNKYKREAIPFHVVSSSIKSLYGLDYYIDNINNENDIIIIDEPELSLHPNNQIELAKAIEILVNSGVRVILSTHSDLFVRELINLIIDNEIKDNESVMVDKNIGIYVFRDKKAEIMDSVFNINYFPNFDESVYKVQDKYNDLLEIWEGKNVE